jgi:hypothetical protein
MLTRVIAGRHKSVTALLLCGVLASMPVAAQRFSADHGRPLHRPHMYLAQGQVESLDSAVSRIRGRTGGRVLSAETRYEGDRPVHHIRILTRNGKVKRIRVAPKPRPRRR